MALSTVWGEGKSPDSAGAPGAGAGVKEREIEIAPGVKMAFVWCPPGSFKMGSPDAAGGASPPADKARGKDERQHEVTLTKGFWIGKYEVTQEQWTAVMGDNPSDEVGRGRNVPVNNVSWDDAQKFLGKVGGGCRLPTEAEWEYACRAGEPEPDIKVTKEDSLSGNGGDLQARYDKFLGDHLEERAWYSANSEGAPHPVGQKKANAWGIYDMLGNVYEWCQDWFGYDYYADGQRDPVGPDSGSYRVSRGGGWLNGASLCRPALRFRLYPVNRCEDLGFRVAVSSTE